jgi:ribosomal protein S18 acetylase RimI-like enzyme
MSPSARHVEPLTPAKAEDLVAFWRTHGLDAARPGEGLAAAVDADDEAAWIRQVMDEWGDCGRLVWGDEGLIAYVKYAPPGFFGAKAGGIAARISSDAVLLSGLCVDSDLAGQGFAKLLISAVEKDLVARSETALEAFALHVPAEIPTATRPVEFYERNGFRLRQPDPALPVMRLELKTILSWTENLDAVVEALLAARAVRRRSTAPAGL